MLKNRINRPLFKIPYFLGVLFPMLIFAAKANAETLIVENNAQISAEISAKELTRISVIGDRITLVRGSEGTYQISNDTIQGAVFIKPTVNQPIVHKICPVQKNKAKNQQKQHPMPCQKLKTNKAKNNLHPSKPFYLFISTEQGRHYVLNLTPRSTRHADVLALKPQELEKEAAKTWETSERYTQTLIHLVDAVLQQKHSIGLYADGFKKAERIYCWEKFQFEVNRSIYRCVLIGRGLSTHPSFPANSKLGRRRFLSIR